MLSELDIWRTAWVMMKRFGDGAALEAAQRADRLLEEGDRAGQAVWLRIVRAIEELLRDEPDGSAH